MPLENARIPLLYGIHFGEALRSDPVYSKHRSGCPSISRASSAASGDPLQNPSSSASDNLVHDLVARMPERPVGISAGHPRVRKRDHAFRRREPTVVRHEAARSPLRRATGVKAAYTDHRHRYRWLNAREVDFALGIAAAPAAADSGALEVGSPRRFLTECSSATCSW